jgi:hypothetical protein
MYRDAEGVLLEVSSAVMMLMYFALLIVALRPYS